ncbi:hypothetical protein RFI_14439 [Reticulomyxa filosa]|uniref:Uncharacterized protein n=1 Tax=Reticulomyxa filosa TaxID=46433 RepID=X6N8Y4_RETFI|nr:hypothetical protein RFI_14439 [Reticulomyxa filosa]|eukprot:ETO22755.1 hypothetical protein RFI_14439 [Reticulomyxa filosa]
MESIDVLFVRVYVNAGYSRLMFVACKLVVCVVMVTEVILMWFWYSKTMKSTAYSNNELVLSNICACYFQDTNVSLNIREHWPILYCLLAEVSISLGILYLFVKKLKGFITGIDPVVPASALTPGPSPVLMPTSGHHRSSTYTTTYTRTTTTVDHPTRARNLSSFVFIFIFVFVFVNISLNDVANKTNVAPDELTHGHPSVAMHEKAFTIEQMAGNQRLSELVEHNVHGHTNNKFQQGQDDNTVRKSVSAVSKHIQTTPRSSVANELRNPTHKSADTLSHHPWNAIQGDGQDRKQNNDEQQSPNLYPHSNYSSHIQHQHTSNPTSANMSILPSYLELTPYNSEKQKQDQHTTVESERPPLHNNEHPMTHEHASSYVIPMKGTHLEPANIHPPLQDHLSGLSLSRVSFEMIMQNQHINDQLRFTRTHSDGISLPLKKKRKSLFGRTTNENEEFQTLKRGEKSRNKLVDIMGVANAREKTVTKRLITDVKHANDIIKVMRKASLLVSLSVVVTFILLGGTFADMVLLLFVPIDLLVSGIAILFLFQIPTFTKVYKILAYVDSQKNKATRHNMAIIEEYKRKTEYLRQTSVSVASTNVALLKDRTSVVNDNTNNNDNNNNNNNNTNIISPNLSAVSNSGEKHGSVHTNFHTTNAMFRPFLSSVLSTPANETTKSIIEPANERDKGLHTTQAHSNKKPSFEMVIEHHSKAPLSTYNEQMVIDEELLENAFTEVDLAPSERATSNIVIDYNNEQSKNKKEKRDGTGGLQNNATRPQQNLLFADAKSIPFEEDRSSQLASVEQENKDSVCDVKPYSKDPTIERHSEELLTNRHNEKTSESYGNKKYSQGLGLQIPTKSYEKADTDNIANNLPILPLDNNYSVASHASVDGIDEEESLAYPHRNHHTSVNDSQKFHSSNLSHATGDIRDAPSLKKAETISLNESDNASQQFKRKKLICFVCTLSNCKQKMRQDGNVKDELSLGSVWQIVSANNNNSRQYLDIESKPLTPSHGNNVFGHNASETNLLSNPSNRPSSTFDNPSGINLPRTNDSNAAFTDPLDNNTGVSTSNLKNTNDNANQKVLTIDRDQKPTTLTNNGNSNNTLRERSNYNRDGPFHEANVSESFSNKKNDKT